MPTCWKIFLLALRRTKRARNSFEETARKEPEEIVSHLREQGRNWTNGKEPDDDVTFVVIKVK